MLAPHPTACTHDQPYWDAAQQGKLLLQRGTRSGRCQFYPRGHSVHLPDEPLEWIESPGLGTVHTYTVVHRSFFENLKAPFVLAIVDLEEGVRMTAHVVDVEPAAVSIGMRVRATFRSRGEGLPVLAFVPA
jgi:uncharacterized OB-fold protein